MTTYQGGKKRIGKRIHKVIDRVEVELLGDEKLPYMEPFCGMCSVLYHFAAERDRDITACDIHPDLILMWQAVQNGWKPPLKCTKPQFLRLKESEPSPERAFIGFSASYGGNFFGNYRLKTGRRNGYLKEASNGVLNVGKEIGDVDYKNPRPYWKFNPSDMLIYCDPPYEGNKLGSDLFTKFDHDAFWETMREWSKYNIVLISEWQAPKDFKKIWCTTSHISNQSVTVKYDDCIYIHEDLYQLLTPKALKAIKKL